MGWLGPQGPVGALDYGVVGILVAQLGAVGDGVVGDLHNPVGVMKYGVIGTPMAGLVPLDMG